MEDEVFFRSTVHPKNSIFGVRLTVDVASISLTVDFEVCQNDMKLIYNSFPNLEFVSCLKAGMSAVWFR